MALALVATTTANQCEEGRNNPFSMTACQIMVEGKPERGDESVKMMQMMSRGAIQ